VIASKEATMNEQLPLFQWRESSWAAKIWEQLGPRARRQVLSLLAEMGKVAVQENRGVVKKEEEDDTGTDHS
jgi:hypothetical protein